jgi:hypothetical protein
MILTVTLSEVSCARSTISVGADKLFDFGLDL